MFQSSSPRAQPVQPSSPRHMVLPAAAGDAAGAQPVVALPEPGLVEVMLCVSCLWVAAGAVRHGMQPGSWLAMPRGMQVCRQRPPRRPRSPALLQDHRQALTLFNHATKASCGATSQVSELACLTAPGAAVQRAPYAVPCPCGPPSAGGGAGQHACYGAAGGRPGS